MNFEGKVVLITGAGSGIGKAAAVHFAKLSADLCLIDVNTENLMQTALLCEKVSSKSTLACYVNLTKDEDVRKVVYDTIEKYGKIDVVVHCAGIFGYRKLCDPDLMKVYDKTTDVNLRSIIAMTNFVTPALIKSKGCMVIISSISGNIATDVLPYNIQKAALNHFTKCVASELAPKGVRVNAIVCGAVKTNLLVNAGMSESKSNAFFERAEKMTPLQVLIDAEEIAELTSYLASAKSASITGVNYIVDAGVSLVGIGKLSE